MDGDEMVTEGVGQMQAAQNRLNVHVIKKAEDDEFFAKCFV